MLRRALLLVVAVLALLAVPISAANAASAGPKTIEITTFPATPQAQFLLDGKPLTTDARGVARTAVPRSAQPHRVDLVNPTIKTAEASAEFVRWYGQSDSNQGYTPTLDNVVVDHTLRLRVAFQVSKIVGFTFVDQAHHPVDPKRVSSITLRSDTGRTQALSPNDAVDLEASRPIVRGGQLVRREATYSVQSVTIDGTNVVNNGEQRFRPTQVGQQLQIIVLLRSAHFRVQDRLLGTPLPSVVRLTYPDGKTEDHVTDANGELVLDSLARGTYTVSAAGEAYSVTQEVALSRSRFVDIRVVSDTDVAIIIAAIVLLIVSLLALGKWRSNRIRMASGTSMSRLPEPAAELVEAPAEPAAAFAENGQGSVNGAAAHDSPLETVDSP